MSSTNDPLPRADFYSADTYRQEESVGAVLKGVIASITHQVDRRLVDHDLTHAQWVPLFKLAHGECGTVAELAFEPGWGEAHPRTRHLLGEEVAQWERSGPLRLMLKS